MSSSDEAAIDDYTKLTCDAAVTASDLISSGLECITALLEYSEKPTVAEAILIAAHALIAQRDKESEENRAELFKWLETIAEKLSDVAESLDFIAASKPDSEA